MQQIAPMPSQAIPQQTNTLELKDIHVPEQITNYPIAYGWWVLAVLFIVILIISIIKLRKRKERNRVKKQALAQLKNNSKMTSNETITLMKWAAMHYFSRVELAKLFGCSLQEFLTSQLPTKHQENFTNLSEQAFLNQYQANKNTTIHEKADENLKQSALIWLTHAIPPRVVKKVNNSQGANI